MARYKRLPVVVNAIQFHPDHKPWPPGVHEIPQHWSDRSENKPARYNFLPGEFNSSGGQILPGDWIVTNPTGERYICREDAFPNVYEPVK